MRTVLGMLICFCFSSAAQQVLITGNVRADTGETLPLAHLIILPDSLTYVSESDGRFAIRVPRGQKTLLISFTGYTSQRLQFSALRDTILKVILQPEVSQLREVVVTAQNNLQTQLFESTRTSTNVLSAKDINAIPVLGGEVDLIKILQLMPGTLRGIEGSADLFVRGGAADQNLVLLDGATIYNTSHLFGFVSVFNPSILESVEAVNGGFPADMGGRLSSIIDVKTNAELADQTHLAGDIGIIASRLYIEQPIIQDKLSIWIGGRRTYIDQVVKLVNEELPYFFYDLNAKIIAKPTERDQLSFSFFNGKDLLNIFRDRNNDGDGFLTAYEAINHTQTLQWNRKLNNNWYSNTTLTRTGFQYEIKNAFEDNRVLAYSDIQDIGLKLAIGNHSLRNGAAVKFGVDWTLHDISPSVVNSSGTISEIFNSSTSQARQAHALAVYGLYEWNLDKQWLLNVGMRASAAVVKNKTYVFPEPRMAVRYKLSPNEALKFSYARMTQFLHRVSNSGVSTPTDVWYPVTDSIRPQTAHQVSLAWQRTLPQHSFFLSLETYYKHMNNLVGFEEGTNLFFNTDFESRIVQGRGNAYGLEALIRKETGKLTGWISYTLSWSNRQFNAINQGRWFRSRYDRRHNGAIVAQYALNKRWSVSAVWEFISGARFTPVIGQYAVATPTSTGFDLLPVYAPINSVKLADTHRLDLGIKFRGKPDKKIQYEWFAGVYNAYNRGNPTGIVIEQNEDGSLYYEQPGLFGLLPFISYGFKF